MDSATLAYAEVLARESLSRVPAGAVCGWGLNNAKWLAVYGTLDPGATTPVLAGYDPDDITLHIQQGDCAAPVIIQLQASVPYNALMLSYLGISNSFSLTAQYEERSIGG